MRKSHILILIIIVLSVVCGSLYAQDYSASDENRGSKSKVYTPPGYKRDSYGNKYQVTFDLRDRFILGLKWSPYIMQGDQPETAQLTIDVGMHTYLYNSYKNTRYRFRFLDGEISLNPGQLDLTLFSFERSNNEKKPMFWITTFWGREPKRHNVYADGGQYFSLLHVVWRPMMAMDYTEVDFVTYYSSADLWNSPNMMNFFRLKYGLSFSGLHHKSGDYGWHHDLNLRLALEGWFVLDASGLHHLRITVQGVYPLHLDETDRYTGVYGEAKLSYEKAFIAISDQPLSLYFEIGGRYRKGLPGSPDELQIRGGTGLRFSFWAPPLPDSK